MAVRMTGAQFKAWLASDWGPDAMWEEEEVWVNGVCCTGDDMDFDPETCLDTDIILLKGGTITPDQSLPFAELQYVDAMSHARKWLKAQTRMSMVLDLLRTDEEEVRAALLRFNNLRILKV